MPRTTGTQNATLIYSTFGFDTAVHVIWCRARNPPDIPKYYCFYIANFFDITIGIAAKKPC